MLLRMKIFVAEYCAIAHVITHENIYELIEIYCDNYDLKAVLLDARKGSGIQLPD